MTAQWWDTLGLVANIVGAVIVFFWGMPQPTFQEHILLAVGQNDPDELSREKRRHMRWAKSGVALLVLGFLLQLIGTWV